MHIKPIARLEPSDLPFAESPDLAVRVLKRFGLHPGSHRLRFSWSDVSGFNGFAPPDVVRARILSGLESGQLILVHDSLSPDGPQLPLAVWVPDSGASPGGAWVAGTGWQNPITMNGVERLNSEGKTPQSVGLSRQLGPSNAWQRRPQNSNPASDAGPQDHRLSSPLGAAAWVTALPEATQSEEAGSDDDGPMIDLTIGIFTDGTLNNYQNTQEFRERLEQDCLILLRGRSQDIEECQTRLGLLLGESYANEPTNVVKLFSLYRDDEEVHDGMKNVFIKVYEPGVGTRSGDDDSLWGMATGLGETGIQSQVRRAFTQVAARIREKVNLDDVRTVHFDLFGFSRGAAAARTAVNDILGGPQGALGAALKAEELMWPKQVSIRFLGLFDTVAGIVNPLRLDFSAANKWNKPVEVNLRPREIGAGIHLVAADECRANFALNSLCSSKGESPANVREIFLPGAHSDIGGGYPDSLIEDLLLHPKLVLTGKDVERFRDTLEWDNLLAVQDSEISEGWVGKHSLPLSDGSKPGAFINVTQDDHPSPDGRVELQLSLKRKVRGELSRIPLQIMHELASSVGAPFREISNFEPAKLPLDIEPIANKLSEQIRAGENEPTLEASERDYLRQQYVHHSHHFNVFTFLAWDEVVKLEPPFKVLNSSQPAKANKRVIHWNRIKD